MKKTTIIILIFSLILNVIVSLNLLKTYNKSNSINLKLQQVEEQVLFYSQMFGKLDNIQMPSIFNEKDQKCDNLKPILYLRLNEHQCGVCINSIINILNNNKYLDSKKIITITSNRNSYFLKRFKYINSINHACYYIKDNKILRILDDIHFPYMFTYDEKNNKIRNVFYHNKGTPELTDFYIRKIMDFN